MPTIRRRSERGQSLVEFALVLMPLFVILLAIIQFGFIFNAYVTITNATREGARNGTVYVYDAAGEGPERPRPERLHQDLVAGLDESARKDVAELRDGLDLDPERRRSRTVISSSPMCSRAEHWIPMRGWGSRSPSAPPTTRTWSSRSSRSSCQKT